MARARGKNFDVDYLQRQLHQMVSQVTEQTESMKSMLNNLESDEASLHNWTLADPAFYAHGGPGGHGGWA